MAHSGGKKERGKHRAARPVNTKSCAECKGTGTVHFRDYYGVKQSESCDACRGKGYVKR